MKHTPIATEPDTRRLASLVRAAEFYGIHERTVRRMISRGDLVAFRLPGSRLIRVDLNELDARLRDIPTAGNLA